MKRLPRSLDDLRGLRAARWVRESTAGQHDRYGPDAQRDQQDRAIERYGLVDAGIAWTVAHSGWKNLEQTPAWTEMLAEAGRSYDVLLVGYVSRWSRNIKLSLNARDELHDAGAALLFCDERILSSDDDQWDQFVREAHEAESYSRRLSRRTAEGYAAKFRRLGDQGGNPPLGFRRVPPDARLIVDAATVGRAVHAFTRYATGSVSLPALAAETGIDRDALRAMLVNPIYNGWVRRHRRRHDEQRLPAPWRDTPPVSDELWARVQEVRHDRYHGGGHPAPVHAHLLAGRLFCAGCGARIRADGHRRYRHHDPCSAWPQQTRKADLIEGPIAAQLQAARHDDAMLVNMRRLAATRPLGPDTTELRRRQLERELVGLAQRHARRALSTEAYLAEHARITGAVDALREQRSEPYVDPDVAIAYLRDLPRLWHETSAEGRREIALAVYEQVLVTSHGIAGVKLTPDAERHFLVGALPETVTVRARPEGIGQPLTVRVPIIGRREWRAALRRIA